MNRTRKMGLILFTAAIVLSILACGGGQPAPTETQAPPPSANTVPPPPATDTPVPPPPTDTPVPAAPEATQPPAEKTGDERTPGQLNILSLNGYQDESDYWHIIGLVANDTERAVSDLEVEVEIFDASEASLYKEVADPMLYNLAPGDTTPFDLWVLEELPGADHFTAIIVGQGSADIERAAVEVSKVNRIVDKYDSINLTGEVTNNGTTPLEVNGLAAALFNDAGELITAASVSVIQHHLEPGDSSAFRISLSAPPDQLESLTDYQLYWDTIVAEPAELIDFTLSDFYKYMDSYENFHLAGSITNNGTKNMYVSMVAGIYDGAGNVLDASSISLPVYYIAPGETLPVDFDIWGPMSYTDDAFGKAEEFLISVDYYWTYESYSELVTISTKGDSNTFDSEEAKFIGYVVNDSGKDLSGATVIVAIYEKGTDKLLATEYDWIFDDIANGAEAAYEVNIYLPTGLDPTTVDYVITAVGDLP